MRVGLVYRHDKSKEQIDNLRFYQVIDGNLHVSSGAGKNKVTRIYNQDDWDKIEVTGEPEPGEKD